jgi:hypothetical protein
MGRELVPGCEQEDINLIFVPISNLTSDRQENTAAGWTHRTNDPGWTIHCARRGGRCISVASRDPNSPSAAQLGKFLRENEASPHDSFAGNSRRYYVEAA